MLGDLMCYPAETMCKAHDQVGSGVNNTQIDIDITFLRDMLLASTLKMYSFLSLAIKMDTGPSGCLCFLTETDFEVNYF